MYLYRIARKANGYVQMITADGVHAAVKAMVQLEPEDAYLSVWSGPKQRWVAVPEERFAELYQESQAEPGHYRLIASEWDQEGD